MSKMKEYIRHAHAVQTAVEFNPDKTSQSPKHLRVGLNMSKADMAGLAKLLIAKGVFTLEEYETAIVNSAADEVEEHRKRLGEELGIDPSKLVLY